MPLPKGIKAALDAWKAGTGEFPGELDDGVFFPSEGAFIAEVGKKAKGREAQARETATAEFLARLGLTDPAEIEAVKETLDKTGVLKTETDKIKAQLLKATKDLEDSRKEIETHKTTGAQLTERIKGIAKRDALMEFAPQTVDPQLLSMVIAPNLEVADDGTVTIKGGDGKKTVADLVAETLKSKPHLKNPAFKEGAGTKTQPDPKTTVNVPFVQKDEKTPLTFAQVAINDLVAKGILQPPAPVTPGGP